MTTCTRSGCPHDAIYEDGLSCMKKTKDKGDLEFGLPAVGSKLNTKVDFGKLQDGLRTIVLNASVIVACILACIFILVTNVYLRSKKIHLKS
jgi:hypothetical protein